MHVLSISGQRTKLWNLFGKRGRHQRWIKILKSNFESVKACARAIINNRTRTFDCPLGVRQGCKKPIHVLHFSQMNSKSENGYIQI